MAVSYQKKGLNLDYNTMLTYDDAIEIFSQWLSKKHNVKPDSLKVKAKGRAEFYIGKVKGNGYVTDNELPLGYSNPVGIFYIGSSQVRTNVMGAVADLEGDSGYWRDLIKERFQAHQASKEIKPAPKLSPEEKAKQEAEHDELEKIREFEREKEDYKTRLAGLATAQFAFQAARLTTDPIYHDGQKIKTVDEHPYTIKKQFEIDQTKEDVFIISNEIPDANRLKSFVNSKYFVMPKNPFGYTKEDVIKAIDTPDPDTNRPYSYNKFFYKSEIKDGIAILPSRDTDGVVTSIQKILLEKPVKEDGSVGVDKLFIAASPSKQSTYIFDYNEKGHNTNFKTILINEGWATGRTVNSIVKDDPNTLNVVAWSASQLKGTTEAFLKKYPDAQVILVADNDIKSFALMDKKTPEKLALVKNTGLSAATEAYASNLDNQHRIGIIYPKINYKNYDLDKKLTDFNDIELNYGKEELVKALQKELDLLELRKLNNESEATRIVNAYNKQAQFFSNQFGLTVNSLELDGTLKPEGIKPENSAANAPNLSQEQSLANNQVTHTPSPENANTAPTIENTNEAPIVEIEVDFDSFFDVPVNDAVKTDFDRKLEDGLNAMFTNKPNTATSELPKENSPEDLVVLPMNSNIANAPKGPNEQPIIDPAAFSLAVYNNALIMQYAEIANLDNKDQMLEKLSNNTHSMSESLRAISIMIDPDMSQHFQATLDKYLPQYKDTPTYDDLMKIKELSSDTLLQRHLIDKNQVIEFNQSLMEMYHKTRKDNGFDVDVTTQMVKSAVARKPIEEKREMFKHFIDNIKNINGDPTWIKEVRATLESSASKAIHDTLTKNKNNDNDLTS